MSVNDSVESLPGHRCEGWSPRLRGAGNLFGRFLCLFGGCFGLNHSRSSRYSTPVYVCFVFALPALKHATTRESMPHGLRTSYFAMWTCEGSCCVILPGQRLLASSEESNRITFPCHFYPGADLSTPITHKAVAEYKHSLFFWI